MRSSTGLQWFPQWSSSSTFADRDEHDSRRCAASSASDRELPSEERMAEIGAATGYGAIVMGLGL